MKMKTLLCAMGLLATTSCFADDFNWNPNLRSGFQVKPGQTFNISGSSTVTATNTTDEPHTYRYLLAVGTDCGTNNGNSGLYQIDITIQPHETFSDTRTVSGYAKCNNPGSHKLSLTTAFSNNSGAVFYKQQFGVVYVYN